MILTTNNGSPCSSNCEGAVPLDVQTGGAAPFDLDCFSPRGYLQQYWPPAQLDHEDEFILRFLHEVYSKYRPTKGLLELGGGPIIDKYISASRFVSHIVHTDFSDKALEEVSLFRLGDPGAWNWQRRCEFVADMERLEEGQALDSSAPAIAQRVRDKLKSGTLKKLNLKKKPDHQSISQDELGSIGVVSVHSVCECVAQTEAEWRSMLDHVFHFCDPGTILVMTANTNTKDWIGGAGPIKAVPLTPNAIIDAVRLAGFINIHTQMRGESGAHTTTESEMSETLALSAIKE